MNFHNYIKAVGTGKKRNRDLSEEEIFDAVGLMLAQKVYPEEISAFLLGWRVKGESVEEFRGALRAFDKYVLRDKIKESIEFGYPYDGKVKNPYLFSLIASILEPFGVNIIISGDKLQPAKGGITTKEICDNIKKPKNLYFFDRVKYFKELSKLSDIRMRLGLRSSFNTVEKLLNPANSKYALMGVFHKPFVEKYIDIFGDRYERLTLVKGNEGTPEIFGKCRFWINRDKKIEEYIIEPKFYGVNYQKSWSKISLKESLEAINSPSNELLKLAKLNSALVLFVIGKVDNFDEGVDMIGV